MKPRIALLFFTISLWPEGAVRAETVQCLECHSTKSNPSGVLVAPYLAGQHPDYIVRQLERFAAGDKRKKDSRSDQTMSPVAHDVPPEKWREAANALSSQECVNLGNAELATYTPNVCASCHGSRGLSASPDVPNLAGQSIRYLFQQYLKFREQYLESFPVTNLNAGESRRHPVMGPVSAQVSDEVVSIMNYYSKLPCR